MHDELLFANEGPDPAPEAEAPPPWKVAVIDDDESVRAITRLALALLKVDGRPLQLLEAASAAEGIALFEAHPDIALGFVDMVMEEPSAGLKVVDAVRGAQGNHKVRLVVRTGQPGHLPEERIVRDYEVNDYREKTELSAQKLRSVATSAIRAYRDLDRMESDYHALAALLAEVAEQQVSGHAGHADGVAALLKTLGALAGLPATRVVTLQHAALLHDLGLVALPEGRDGTISAGRRIDDETHRRVRDHAAGGAHLLAVLASPEGQLAARLAREHHERWDGTGYPDGLAGEAIALESRLLALANALDMQLAPVDGSPAADAAAIRVSIEAEAGRAYDPALAALALAHLPLLVDVHRRSPGTPP